MIVLAAILIFVIAYFYGMFSTARVLAKTFRSLNVYKLGTGLADTENIFSNVSKSMGILVGILDASKAYLFMVIVEVLLRFLDGRLPFLDIHILYHKNLMLFYGLGMLLGHCLPYKYSFRGGRGIFTYMGFFSFFAFWPPVVTALIALFLVLKYKQIRFAQYIMVILPAILYQAWYYLSPGLRAALPSYFTVIMFACAVFMGVLNFFVSKRLGEL